MSDINKIKMLSSLKYDDIKGLKVPELKELSLIAAEQANLLKKEERAKFAKNNIGISKVYGKGSPYLKKFKSFTKKQLKSKNARNILINNIMTAVHFLSDKTITYEGMNEVVEKFYDALKRRAEKENIQLDIGEGLSKRRWKTFFEIYRGLEEKVKAENVHWDSDTARVLLYRVYNRQTSKFSLDKARSIEDIQYEVIDELKYQYAREQTDNPKLLAMAEQEIKDIREAKRTGNSPRKKSSSDESDITYDDDWIE